MTVKTTSELVGEFVERLVRIEGELKLLQEDKKMLFDEYKDKLDVKALRAAIRIAKIKSKLSDTSEAELDSILESVENKITIDFIE
jgi:uncharacterized protein (UPF0335 family)